MYSTFSSWLRFSRLVPRYKKFHGTKILWDCYIQTLFFQGHYKEKWGHFAIMGNLLRLMRQGGGTHVWACHWLPDEISSRHGRQKQQVFNSETDFYPQGIKPLALP